MPDELLRPYSKDQVKRLQGSFVQDYSLSKLLSKKLRNLLKTNKYIHALGASSGDTARNYVKAGLKSIYLSGWQVAASANANFETYPDQSLYDPSSGPNLQKQINNSLLRADQVQHIDFCDGKIKKEDLIDYFVPTIADAEAGFGGILNVFELVKKYIAAGSAGIHLEDQLSSAKKCGHMSGKCLIPTAQAVSNLISARLAADVCEVPLVILARTDANAAKLITSDHDENDKPFLTGERSPEGLFFVKAGIEQAISRGLAYGAVADILWCETAKPNIEEAKIFAEAIHKKFPNKMLAYNCSPSFNWLKSGLSEDDILNFQNKLSDFGYRYFFITLANFHNNNYNSFELARAYKDKGVLGYTKLQEKEFAAQKESNFTAIKHQTEVGAGYFDAVNLTITAGKSSTRALGKDSTEKDQF